MATKKNIDKKDNPKKDIKKISIIKLEKIMNETYQPITEVEWRGIKISVKRDLSLPEALSFVRSVVDSCFLESDGEYMPEARDFAIKELILTMYANFTMPKNVDKQYDLIYRTDAVSEVCKYINTQQLNELVVAVDKKIDYLVRVNIQSIENKIRELYSLVNSFSENMAEIFKDIDKDSLGELLGAMSNLRLDERKLMDAYFDKKQMQSDDKEELSQGITNTQE